MTFTEQEKLELIITILKGLINNQPNYTNTTTSTGTDDKEDTSTTTH